MTCGFLGLMWPQTQYGALLTNTGAARADADGKGSVLVKVGGDDGDAWYEQHTCAEAEAEALSEEGLVVLGHQTGHHQAENDKRRSHAEKNASVTSIENGTREHADEKEKKALDGADPRDGRGRVRTKKVGLIKGLVRAKRVDHAPEYESR